MADYATKRVPLDPDDGELGEMSPRDDSESLEELRHLIIAPEQADLARLQQRIDNPEQRTRDVSEVLPEAMLLRREQGGEQALGEALAPSVEAALRESVRKDPGTLADALFPVMGPAIRRSILQTLRSLFESFNQTMEQSLSIRGLKWRFEALRTGRPFSEVVLVHSLVFRIEQIFLIHKKTGLPLAHAVAASAAMQDPSLVSGMLTAIQDFVRDSFNAAPGESVEKLNVGELEVWVESGPYASIAAVIRGMAPPELRIELAETLEEIHAKFGAQMERFTGDAAPFVHSTEMLAHHLDARYREKAGVRPKPYLLVFASLLLLALAAWLSVRWWQGRQWSKFAAVLESKPGITVTSFGRQGGHFVIRGLRDPLAADPNELVRQAGLDVGRAEFHWNGYYALDDEIVQKRAVALLRPPFSTKLAMTGGVLHADGEAPRAWIEAFRVEAPLIAGVQSVDLSRLADADEAEFARAKATIEATVLKFAVGSSEISAGDLELLKGLSPKLREVLRPSASLHQEFSVEIVGHSDSTGAEATNRPLSQSRADRVASLLAQGFDRKRFRPKGVAASEPLRTEESEEARQYNRSVTLRIVPLGTARP
jgi:outer membrane protein OmpA-like peptidoglycan-associated protein